MNTSEPRVVAVERVDDIPVLLAALKRLRLPELFDRHFPAHPLWEGELSPGDVVCVWLAFILSEGDHCLSHLEPWAQQRLLTLQACLGKPVRPLDFHDDRLADLLDSLASPDSWDAFEADLNHQSVRVYDLQASCFRIDTTTANSHAAVVSEQGLLQFGHSKDDPNRPQLKVAICALDPLGLPVTTAVVPGSSADDPLYVPVIQKVQATFGSGGKTYVGDCKMASFATRLHLAASNDFYLCPLSESQLSSEQRGKLLEPVWRSEQKLEQVFRPAQQDEAPELVAEGFRVDAELSGEVDGKLVKWTERRWLVRSVAFAQAQQEALEARVARAEAEIARLNERRQGKKRLSLEQAEAEAQRIVEKHGVANLLGWDVLPQVHQRQVRGYNGQPARLEREEDYKASAWRFEEALTEAQRSLGWQVYAGNDARQGLAEVVWTYRGQIGIEQGWSRLKGRPLSLTPMYLADEDRMVGLVLLLSLALRMLQLTEWQAREELARGNEVLRGLYPGQPGRKTARPSAELLLRAFRGISLVVVESGGSLTCHVTPLNALQKRLLQLWNLPPDLFQLLETHSSKPPPVSSER